MEEHYYCEYELGYGAYQERIVVATHKDTSQRRLVKQIRKSQAKVPAEEVVRTLSKLKSLRHPYLNPLLEWYNADETYDLVYAYPEGGEVQDFVDTVVGPKNRIDERSVALYIQQLLMVLNFLHSHADLRHRNIGPSNVYLSTKLPDAVILLGDAGLSSVFKDDAHLPTDGEDDVMAVGKICFLLLINKKMNEHHKFYEEDGWADRSRPSRDFIRGATDYDPLEKLTIGQALHHPWLQHFATEFYQIPENMLSSSSSHLSQLNIKKDDRLLHRATIACTVILALRKLPPKAFERARQLFLTADSNRDGYITTGEAVTLLEAEYQFTKSRKACQLLALTGVVDLATFIVMLVLSVAECTQVESLSELFLRAVALLFEETVKDPQSWDEWRHNEVGHHMELYADCDLQQLLDEVAGEGDLNFQSQDEMQRALIESEGRGMPCGAPFDGEDIYADTSDLDSHIFLSLTNLKRTFQQGLVIPLCGIINGPSATRKKRRYQPQQGF